MGHFSSDSTMKTFVPFLCCFAVAFAVDGGDSYFYSARGRFDMGMMPDYSRCPAPAAAWLGEVEKALKKCHPRGSDPEHVSTCIAVELNFMKEGDDKIDAEAGKPAFVSEDAMLDEGWEDCTHELSYTDIDLDDRLHEFYECMFQDILAHCGISF